MTRNSNTWATITKTDMVAGTDKTVNTVSGGSMPGTTGDSEGTFHDRASSDNNVIIGGKVQKYGNHKREQTTGSGTTQKSRTYVGGNQSEPTGQLAEMNREVVEVEVNRFSGSGNPIAVHRGIHVHVPDGDPGE